MAMKYFVVGVAFLVLGCAAQDEPTEPTEPKEKLSKEEEEAKAKREKVAQYTYCQEDDCYELLGVKKTSAQPAIKRAYRKLAAEWHPDKNPDPRAKELFPKYANAYSVLSDQEMRENYDYLMEHPHEFPGFFMRYSKPTYMPKSDVRFVVVLSLLAISAIQFMFKQSQYKTMLESAKKSPNGKEMLRKLTEAQLAKPTSPAAKKGGGFRGDAGTTKGKKETPKAEVLEEAKKAAEAALEKQLIDELGAEPKLLDTLIVEVFKLPLTTAYFLQFHVGWFVNFRLLGKEYGDAEKAYLTRVAIGLTSAEWDEEEDAEKEELVGRELWVAENLTAWNEEVDKLNGGAGKKSSKEKRLKRQKKKGPIGNVGMLD